MEWLDQTRRINKSVDRICMSVIDSTLDVLPYLDRKMLRNNRRFFDRFCTYYHKTHPMKLHTKIKKIKTCKILSEFVQASIKRSWQGIEMVEIQWMEIVDYMYDYPNLVNPRIIEDDYVVGRIGEVCKKYNKMNPLRNGTQKKFGKMWKDRDGIWHPEKRRRF